MTVEHVVLFLPYIMFGYLTLMFLDLASSPLARRIPLKGKGSVSMPIFIMLSWPFAILLYILMVPVLLVKTVIYTVKGRGEWLS